ncbi:hypothetical protein D3C80_1298090 [compost metagenome]
MLQVAGDETAGVDQVAVGQGDPGIGAAAGGGSDARYHLTIDAVLQEEVEFFGAPAEDERVAALEPHHPLALGRQVDQQLVDLCLGQAVVAADLANVMAAASGRDQGQQFTADQAVIDHGIGLHQQAPGAQGEQARIAGPGTDQGDFAGAEGRVQGGR